MHAKIFLQTAIVLIRGCLQISSALNRPAGRIRALDPLYKEVILNRSRKTGVRAVCSHAGFLQYQPPISQPIRSMLESRKVKLGTEK